jgi:hypothetical protein
MWRRLLGGRIYKKQAMPPAWGSDSVEPPWFPGFLELGEPDLWTKVFIKLLILGLVWWFTAVIPAMEKQR